MIRLLCFLVLYHSAETGETYIVGGGSLINVRVEGCYELDPSREAPLVQQPMIPEEVNKNCFSFCRKVGKSYAGLDHVRKLCYCLDTLEGLRTILLQGEPKCFNCHRIHPCDARQLAVYNLDAPTEDESVSMLLGMEDDVQLLNFTYFTNKVLTGLGSRALAVDYHYGLGEGFVLTNDSVFRFPLAVNHSATTSPFLEEMSIYANCGTFTVDWVHNHIIWPICNRFAGISMVTLTGEEEQWTLLELPRSHPAHVVDIVVDPYASLIFWTTRHALVSCGLDGRNLRTLVRMLPAWPTSMALDLDRRRIYISGQKDDHSIIFYTDYNGSKIEITSNFSHDDGKIWSVDVFRSNVYFMMHDPDNITTIADLTKYPQNIVGKWIQEIFDIKLMHRELQATPANRIDACTDRGCAHHCVVEQQVARCRCVRGFTLASDLISCQELPNGPGTVDVAVMCLVSVLFIVLAAGVLMGMADKMWSKDHPRVVVLYSKGDDTQLTNNTAPDYSSHM